MERTDSIPGWVARRGWSRRNPAWVRAWLVRKPKADRRGTALAEETTVQETGGRDAPAKPATILPFSRTGDRVRATAPMRPRAEDTAGLRRKR